MLLHRTCPRCDISFVQERSNPTIKHGKPGGNPYCLRCRRERMYGMEVGEYDRLLLAQGNRCVLCSRHLSELIGGRGRGLCVDHDHKTGRVRGLICHWCNSVVAWLETFPETIESALVYIQPADEEEVG